LLEVLSAGEVGQDKGDGTPCDFSMLAASGVSIVRSRTRDLGLSRKPEQLGIALPQVEVISNPLCRVSDIRTIWIN
jgi:hypothetical protein